VASFLGGSSLTVRFLLKASVVVFSDCFSSAWASFFDSVPLSVRMPLVTPLVMPLGISCFRSAFSLLLVLSWRLELLPF